MKNSREHAQRLRKLYRNLKQVHPKPEMATYDDPVDALIYGIISEKMTRAEAEAAMRGIRKTFINWNDLRVSRTEEIVEVFGSDTPALRETAMTLTTALRGVFDGYHTVSLQALKKLGKRPARQAIEKLGTVSRFAVSYCMLTSLQSHAVPLTGRMMEYLKRHKIVDGQADEEEIDGFLTRQVAARNAYEFYALLRRECECPKLRDKEGRKASRPKAKKAAKTRK
jgi:endonuclease III